jgi:hypothetical protein
LRIHEKKLPETAMASSSTLPPNALSIPPDFLCIPEDVGLEERFWAMGHMIPVWQELTYNLLASQCQETLAERAQDGMEWEFDEEYERGEWIATLVASMVSVREWTEH